MQRFYYFLGCVVTFLKLIQNQDPVWMSIPRKWSCISKQQLIQYSNCPVIIRKTTPSALKSSLYNLISDIIKAWTEYFFVWISCSGNRVITGDGSDITIPQGSFTKFELAWKVMTFNCDDILIIKKTNNNIL